MLYVDYNVNGTTLTFCGVWIMSDAIIMAYYTVVYKKRATFIFSITLANIDGFS